LWAKERGYLIRSSSGCLAYKVHDLHRRRH
jgi:hypothetical protein